MGTTIYTYTNIYNLLNNVSKIGNILIFLAFMLLLSSTIIGVLITFVNNKEKLYKFRKIATIAESAIWLLCFLLFINHILVGLILIVLTSIANTVCLFKVNQNTYDFLK